MEFSNLGQQNEPPMVLGIHNNKFKYVKECKFLGVIFNERLTWSDQIKHVINQESKSCGIIQQKIMSL